jgi:hypothetical protein
MTEREHAGLSAAVRAALASVIIAGGALTMAGQAAAEPVVPLPPPPVPGEPAAVPGQPVAAPPVGPLPPPAPVGPPVVPQISNPTYGGQSGSPFGYLGDIWRAARSGDPVGALAGGPAGPPAPPPPGAGPAPALPPGFVSMTAPESTTSAIERSSSEPVQGPPLPEGYFSLSEPPPPGWYDGSAQPIFGGPAEAAAPPGVVLAPPAP